MLIYVDTTGQSLVVSPNDVRRCLPPQLTAGDTVPIALAFLQRNPQPLNTGQPIFNYLDFHSSGVVLSVGPFGAPPSSGSFFLTFGANTTPALDWNISSYDLADALNALASIVSAGGVSVLGNVGGPWEITFLSNGSRSAFSSASNALVPASSVTIASEVTGTATNPSVQVITLAQVATAKVTSWTPQAAPVITVTSIQGNVIQRVSIPAGTYGGSFTLTYNGNTTAAIPFAAQLDVVEAALNALPGMSGITVWPGQNFWDITIPGGLVALTGSATGLIVPLTLTGSLVLTSQAVISLLNGSQDPVLVPFLIQTTNGSIQTYFDYLVQLNAP